ncbi:MAG: UDP-N-acetylmuramoyl-tripeptide--D-alanyl-D-alanine ligase [Tepidisphaeraceae bacterium]
MKPLTIQQIRQAVRGKFLAPQPEESPQSISCVCTDTRRIEPGSLFIALRGENFDGHQFLSQAAAGGAIAALVEGPLPQPLPNVHLIQVPNTRTAMGMLARYVRKHMRAKVIGVAGSNGKTSTKYLIHTALGAKLRGSASPKSFNNDIGVPLAIFPADPNQDYLVLEMGTNHHGEIRILTDMALPDIAVITNCGAEHLEFLDDLMGVRRENATIIAGLNPKGLLIVNGDDRDLVDAIAHYPGQKVTFGFGDHNDLFASNIECTERGVTFKLNGSRDVFVPMLGKHTAANALAAIAVARRLRISEEAIIESLATAEGPDMRLQLDEVRGIKLLNDAYNANPNSMRAALETVAALPTMGRRIAVLGEMRELGKSSDRYHREIGEFAATCKLDMLVCVGPKGALIAEAAQKSGMSEKVISAFPDAPTAAPVVCKAAKPGDLVLLKASRTIRLETIAAALAEVAPGPSRARKVAS